MPRQSSIKSNAKMDWLNTSILSPWFTATQRQQLEQRQDLVAHAEELLLCGRLGGLGFIVITTSTYAHSGKLLEI